MDELFNLFDNSIFGRPVNVRFNTYGTKDMLPAYWSKWEKEDEETKEKEMLGYRCSCRTIGINEEDISISIEDYGIKVEGESTYNGMNYSQHIELPIAKSILSSITDVNYESKNGITYIYIKIEIPEKQRIKVRRLNG